MTTGGHHGTGAIHQSSPVTCTMWVLPSAVTKTGMTQLNTR